MSIRFQESKIKIGIRKRSWHIGNEDYKLLKPLWQKYLHTGCLGDDGKGASLSTGKETIKEAATRPVLKNKVHKNIFFFRVEKDLNYYQ